MTFAARYSWSSVPPPPPPAPSLLLQYDVTGFIDPAYFWDTGSGFTGSPTVTFSVDNDTLTWSPTAASTSVYVATGTGISTGKVYCEFACTANTGNMPLGFGVQSTAIDQFYQPNGASIFAGAGGCGLGTQGLYLGATLVSADAGYSFTVGDRIGIAFDADTQDVWFSKNGTWISGDPATGTSPSTTLTNPDPDIANVTLLLHMNGVNGSTTFTDSSSYATTITAFSGAAISTAQSEFGGASGLFVLANNDYISAPTSAQFQFAGDFTVECWIRPTALGVAAGGFGKVIFDTRASGSSSGGVVVYIDNGLLNYYTAATNTAGTVALVANTWIHVALTRSGTAIKMWQGGVQAGANRTVTANLSDGLFAAAREAAVAGSYFDGYIDEFRVTNGVARYTATFTPPTVQFPDASFGVAPFYFTAGQYACATTGGTHSQQVYPRPAVQLYAAPVGFTAYAQDANTISLSLDEFAPVPIVAPLNVLIDWDDGATTAFSTAGTYSHTYAATGTYVVSLAGVCSAVDTLNQPELQGVNAWDNSLGLLFLNLTSSGANALYVPDTLPSTLRSVRISGSFNDASVVLWDTSNLTDMESMFDGVANFNQPINVWDTSAVTTMASMFSGASAFNQPLADWSTDNVTDMTSMFANATVFDQDISLWCVYQILTLPTGFNTGGTLTPAYFPVWGTCPVAIPLPITLYGGGYNAFAGPANIPLPITLSR